MGENKNAGLFLVYDLILLISFIGLIIMAFNFGGALLIGELALICLLLLLAFIAVIGVYAGAKWSHGMLFFVFALVLADLIFIYYKTRTIGAIHFVSMVVSAIGFIVSIASIRDEDKFDDYEPAPEEADEVEPETKYTPGKYVASKSASNYHAPKCDWAKKIKKSNQVWFESEDEAKEKGYKAHSCLE